MLPTVCYLLSLRVRLCMCACEREHGIQKVKATVIEENRKWVGVGGREGGEETENELISLLPHPFCFPQMNLSCYLMICFFGSQAIHIPCYLCVSPPPPPSPRLHGRVGYQEQSLFAFIRNYKHTQTLQFDNT